MRNVRVNVICDLIFGKSSSDDPRRPGAYKPSSPSTSVGCVMLRVTLAPASDDANKRRLSGRRRLCVDADGRPRHARRNPVSGCLAGLPAVEER